MTELKIAFPDADPSHRSTLAADLKDELGNVPGIESAAVSKERTDTQDVGAIISIVLAAPAIIAAVRALHAFLIRSNQTSLEIRKPDGTVVMLRNAHSEDVAAVAAKVMA